MRTRQVGWMFHEKSGRHYHQLFVPSGKVPPNLAVDAINWEAPIVDDLDGGFDPADAIAFHVTGTGINHCEPRPRTPGLLAQYRKNKAWVYESDRSNEKAEQYREQQELLKAIQRAYEHAEWDAHQKAENQRGKDALKQTQAENEEHRRQRERQLERNKRFRAEEDAEREERANRHDYPRLPSQDAGIAATHPAILESIRHAEREWRASRDAARAEMGFYVIREDGPYCLIANKWIWAE